MPAPRAFLRVQAEQERLREDFAMQAEAMDRLAQNAGAAALERDRAWQVSRVQLRQVGCV